MSGMGEDVGFSGWELPPLGDDPDREPPPGREYRGGVSIGSDLVGLRHAGTGCRRDHRAKHQAGWQVRRNLDGTTTWTSPQGREYTNHPPQRWKVSGE